MLTIQPFHRSHYSRLNPQIQQIKAKGLPASQLEAIEASYTFTVFADDTPIAVAGLIEHWAGRWMAWCILSEDARRHLFALTKIARQHLALIAEDRVEASVDCDFSEGHRWLKLLGFECETPRAKHYSGNTDYALYAKVGANNDGC